MTAMHFTSPDESDSPSESHDQSDNFDSQSFNPQPEISKEERFAREVAQLEEVFLLEAAELEQIGFVPHDESSYLEIEALQEAQDQLTQILGIRQAPFFESDYDDYQAEEPSTFSDSEYGDNEDLPPDPERNLQPANIDFEIRRGYFKHDDEGNRTHAAMMVESRLQEDDGPVWCFPEVRSNPDGTQELHLQKVNAPISLLYYTSAEGDIKLAVQFSKSSVEQFMEDAVRDLNSLPSSIEAKIKLLALASAYEAGFWSNSFVMPRHLEFSLPHSLSHDKTSFCLTIEPLGIYRLTMQQNPENAQVGIELEQLASFYETNRPPGGDPV